MKPSRVRFCPDRSQPSCRRLLRSENAQPIDRPARTWPTLAVPVDSAPSHRQTTLSTAETAAAIDAHC